MLSCKCSNHLAGARALNIRYAYILYHVPRGMPASGAKWTLDPEAHCNVNLT